VIALWIIGTLGTLLLVEMQRRANQQMLSRQHLLEERMDMQAQRLERLEQVDRGGAPYRRAAPTATPGSGVPMRNIAIPGPGRSVRR
jgi:hypothetical protein